MVFSFLTVVMFDKIELSSVSSIKPVTFEYLNTPSKD